MYSGFPKQDFGVDKEIHENKQKMLWLFFYNSDDHTVALLVVPFMNFTNTLLLFQMTVADLAFFVYVDYIFLVLGVEVYWKDYPKLKGILNRVADDPKIAEYLQTRPQTAY